MKTEIIIGLFVAAMYAGGCVVAYNHGVSVTSARFERVIAQNNADNATELAKLQAKTRATEQAKAAQLATIDEAHQKAIHDQQIISDRTIADLRNGTIRLRDKFTNEFAAASRLPSATAGPSVDYAAASIKLQQQDAEFLIFTAGEADQIADQLRACQAVVRADRGQ